MSLIDSIIGLFGGGATLSLSVDADTTPAGGSVSGKVRITGGKREQVMQALAVRLQVRAQPHAGRILVEDRIAADRPVRPGQTDDYTFCLHVPADAEESGPGVGYAITATADLPATRAPTATHEVHILPIVGASAEDIFERWPALHGADQVAIKAALHEMRWKHDPGVPDDDLAAAEPVLARLLREGPAEVCSAALETWARVLEGRVTPAQVRVLVEADRRDDIAGWSRREVIDVAARYREQGGMDVVWRYASHADPELRKGVARALDRHHGPLGEDDRTVLESLAIDPVAAVRAETLRTLGTHSRDVRALMLAVSLVDHEYDPAALVALTAATSALMVHDDPAMVELALLTVDKLAMNEHPRVRRAASQGFGWTTRLEGAWAERTVGVMRLLMADPDLDVRRYTATEIHDHISRVEGMWDLALELLDNEDSEQLKGSIVHALGNARRHDECLALYRELLDAGASEEVCLGMIAGVRHASGNPHRDTILDMLGASSVERVTLEARVAIEAIREIR